MVAGNQTYLALSKVLSTSTFRKIILEKDDMLFRKQVKRYSRALDLPQSATNLDVIREIYKCLNKNYRFEYLYKNTLFNDLVKKKKLKDSVVLNELRISKSIADTVIVNGEAILYEIKTELDNPEKLLSQIDDYKKAFSKIYVVTHQSIFYKYYQLIKGSGVGLMYFDDKNKLVEHKQAESENKYLDHTVLFKLLRKQESISLILEYFGEIPNVPNTKFFRSCLEQIERIPIETFQHLVMLQLKKRISSEQGKSVTKYIPRELRYICYSLNLKTNDYIHLSNYLTLSFKA